jgi:hypothetical protein
MDLLSIALLIFIFNNFKQSTTTPKKGGMMFDPKRVFIKIYLPQRHRGRRAFGFFLLFAETPKSKMTQPFG